MKNKHRFFSLSGAVLFLFILCSLSMPAGAEEFPGLFDYQGWAVNAGYPQGLLVPLGINGINQDYFHTLPDSGGYTSGKIVIGDSRCCQLGIWESRTGADDYAVFAVWGGHYVPGTGTDVLTSDHLSEIDQCFREQIRTRGSCTIFFFATVNDYDYVYGNNSGFIAAAIDAAETIASMSYEYDGTVYRPQVIVIGFEGGDAAGYNSGIPQNFNWYVDSYNSALREAVSGSPVLSETAERFTAVSEITGGNTTFINDGLHYSDDTLQKITEYIRSVGK